MRDPRPGYLIDLPLTQYTAALDLQRAAATARHTDTLDRDLVILLEHPPVFTLGRRGGKGNLLVTEEQLERRGIPIVPIERGGDITYHGPGQLVVYIIVALKPAGLSVLELVTALEAAMIRTAAAFEVAARGDSAYRGAWVGNRKLGSVGVTIRRGVSFHGLALNANTDLEPFGWINPCGIEGCTMTSLERETGRSVDMAAVRRLMAGHLSDLLSLRFERIDYEQLPQLISPGVH